MELFTLGRDYSRQDVIDKFHSAIWTSRYYGDSEVELVVPTTVANTQILKPNVFLGLEGEREIMVLETANFTKDGKLKMTGISILKWLNNRFVRSSAKHEDRYWYFNSVPGTVMAGIIYYHCVAGPFLDGTTPTGIPNPQNLVVPGLFTSGWDTSGTVQNMAVPYGPVFDAAYEIATTYQLGQQVILTNAQGNPNRLQYRNYKGIDRTSRQTANPVVRFSSQMESLTDIEELQSMANYKTVAYAFAPGLDTASRPLAGAPGIASAGDLDGGFSIASVGSGFDLRALQVFAEDITTDQIGADANKLLGMLNSKAKDALSNNEYVRVVDGEIVPTAQFKYGRDYTLGDLIEIQGNSGTVNVARVIEYIRTQDESGERGYPTVKMT